jgi:hypothetical protein
MRATMPRVYLLPAATGKKSLFWFLACFLAGQVALWGYLDRWRTDLVDPLYALRLRSLRARLAESPGAPLVLILGSSRTKYGVSPAAISVRGSAGVPPLIYNFALNGSGSIRELLYFRRLLADGIRPDWLLVETWPPLWTEEGYFAEWRTLLYEDELRGRDLPLLCRYFPCDRSLWVRAFQRSLAPIQFYRSRLLLAAASTFLTHKQREEMARDRDDWVSPDDTGWFPLAWTSESPDQRSRTMRLGTERLKPLLDPVRVDARSDTALREILDECRKRGIKAAVFLLPEHSVTRGWYTPQSHALVRSYLGRLGRDYQVPILDMRGWLPDEAFADCAHIGLQGAGPFSERFGREVLQPLLHGVPLPDGILLRDDGVSP